MNFKFAFLGSATASLLTSRWLLVGELTYPLALAALQLSTLALSQLLLSHTTANEKEVSRGDFRWKLGDLFSILLHNAIASAALIFGMKTIQFSGSLSVAVLLLTYDLHLSYFFKRCFHRQLSGIDVVRCLLLALGLGLILAFDFRLSQVNRNLSIAFLFLAGIEECFRSFLQGTGLGPGLVQFQCKVLPACSAAIIGIIAFYTEIWRATTMIATATAFHSYSIALIGPKPQLHGPETHRIEANPGFERKTLLVILAGQILIGNWLALSETPIVSTWQYVGYLFGLLAFVLKPDSSTPSVRLQAFTPVSKERHPDEIEFGLDDDVEGIPLANSALHVGSEAKRQDGGGYRGYPWSTILILCGLSWLPFYWFVSTTSPPLLDFGQTNIDHSFNPTSGLDLVISRYGEPATAIASNINRLFFALADQYDEQDLRIFIYNKNTDTEDFEQAMAYGLWPDLNYSVVPLENTGREGGTYLHHIVSRWDDLAAHTLFVQDAPHDFTEMISRTVDYLVPQTGFLPLSYQGRTCSDCNHCHDRNMSQNSTILADLFSKANSGRECRDLVLTYRGQFIVSGQRIRGNGAAMYEDLLRDMQDPESWMHASWFTDSLWSGDLKDSLNDPVFGYTLEVMWGALMQCSGQRLGNWSPSIYASHLRSTWLGMRFPLENVQCLDRPIDA